jgi:hypothetical protein
MSASLPGSIIWERTIDRERQRARWRRLLLWYVAPVAVIAIAIALAVDPASALGFLILTGGLGLLIALWLGLTNVNERTGASLRFDGRHLGWRDRTVDAQAVATYTTYSSKIRSPVPLYSTLLHGSNGMAIDAGYARFSMVDGSTVQFVWPSMPPAQMDDVRRALDQVLPGRWQPGPGRPAL